MGLVRPAMQHLPGYVDALERGWSADNVRGVVAAREELEKIRADPGKFVEGLFDREAKGSPVTLPDGTTVPRLPGYRMWLWDGEFCGSIGLRWQPGTCALPAHVLGHIGYAVVPWKQRRGYATKALRLLLPHARAEGLEYVEITTDPDNLPSQRVVLANGGVLVERFRKPPQYGDVEGLRFRIELEPRSADLVRLREATPEDAEFIYRVERHATHIQLELGDARGGHTTTDTGTTLRSLYAAEGGVRSIYSAKVADYIASRPDYPGALFDTLREDCRLSDGAEVADIGAGTGLLTQDLLRRGYRVTAVEPNPSMRAASDARLGGLDGYRSVDGCAESIPLATASVDLVTAAQAFHWFDIERARAEMLRVLVPGGFVALVWNDRALEDPLHVALNDVFAELGGTKRAALLAHVERLGVERFYGTSGFKRHLWPHEHLLDENGLLALVFSRSHMPARDSDKGSEVARRVSGIFNRFAVKETVIVRYVTVAHLGQLG